MDLFNFNLDKIPSDDEIPEEELEAEEEEEVEEPDELTVSINEEIAECFALFDKTKSGIIDIKYLEKALKCLGLFYTSTEMEDVVEELNTDGFVQLENFRNFTFEKIMRKDPFESLKSAFQVFDSDDEGIIPSDRLKRWMMSLGNPLTEKEAKELVKLGDPANKGVVAYEALIGFLLAP